MAAPSPRVPPVTTATRSLASVIRSARRRSVWRLTVARSSGVSKLCDSASIASSKPARAADSSWRVRARFVARTAWGESPARRSASAMASASRALRPTTRWTRPRRWASCGRHAIAGEQIGARRRDTSQQGPHDRAAIARYQAEADPGLGQVGLLRHEHDVAEQGQCGPRADGRAVHCRDHRDLEGDERPEEGAASVERRLTKVGVPLHLFHEAEVASGAEGVPRSGQDEDSHFGLVGHGAHGRQHRRVQRTVEGVAAGWAIESEDPHP